MSAKNAGTHASVSAADRDAARRALARNWPDLPKTSGKYAAFERALAEFHQSCGPDSFELRYRLRPAKNRMEEWTRQFMHEEITATEFRERVKADAERPIDLEMLTGLCDAYQANVEHYGGALRAVVPTPHNVGIAAWRAQEEAVDAHVTALQSKLPLWRENIETALDFLEELRVTSGKGLITLGEFEGTSAHWLAQLIFTRLTEAWRSCKAVSERSRRDPRYLYAARAADLFHKQWSSTFPTPQSVSERLREEFVLARVALKRVDASAAFGFGNREFSTQPSAVPSDIERLADNESRELILIGKMFSLVGEAGHIFRTTQNSDWGIDGEIEFKDGVGHASGRRVYVQLKSGDSYLAQRRTDGEEIFSVRNPRHLDYWAQQAYPVMLVIRQSSGLIRWMDMSAYLQKNGRLNRQIVFHGELVTPTSICQLAERSLRNSSDTGR